MMMTNALKYPIGVQSFEEIRTDGYAYVDKTALLFQLISSGSYYFFARPRRFGKSLMLSTLECYFKGRRDLFKGLAIDALTDDWTEYPVLHLDLHVKRFKEEKDLEAILDEQFTAWEEEYGLPVDKSRSPELRFGSIIAGAFEKTQKKVVVLVDEYDRPLTEAILDEELSASFRETLRAVYSNFKNSRNILKFVMVTGVSRFSKMTIFSGPNNLNDISMNRSFETLCGITQTELIENFRQGIQELAESLNLTYDMALTRLKEWYDGYQFSKEHRDVYNPFSLLSALYSKEFGNYWFQTGTPTFLVRYLSNGNINFQNFFNGDEVSSEELTATDTMMLRPLAMLYQTGYLTIKRYDPLFDSYTLGFPNREVKEGFLKDLYGYLLDAMVGNKMNHSMFSIIQFSKDIFNGNLKEFMRRLKSLISCLNIKGDREAHFQNAVFIIFSLVGFNPRMEVHSSRGLSDLEIITVDCIYIFEFKINSNVDSALKQIHEKGYATPYLSSNKHIELIGANFSTKTKNLTDWESEKLK